jgi:hypothetical protein
MIHALCFSIVHAKGSHEKVALVDQDRFMMQIMLGNNPSNGMIQMDHAVLYVV